MVKQIVQNVMSTMYYVFCIHINKTFQLTYPTQLDMQRSGRTYDKQIKQNFDAYIGCNDLILIPNVDKGNEDSKHILVIVHE